MKKLLIPSLLCMVSHQASAVLTAAYRFNETSGNVAADLVRGGTDANANGTLSNFSGSQWVPGKIGNALAFDGSNDYVWANDPVATGATNLTVSAWIYANSAPTWGTIVKNWGGGAFHFGFNDASGKISNYLNTGGAGVAVDPAVLTLNAWHHVAFTYDGTVGEHKLYIDGLLALGVSGANASLSSAGTTMGIGAKLNDGSSTTVSGGEPGYWNGMIDDLAFFDNTLNSAEILAIKNNGDLGIGVIPEPTCAALLGFGSLVLLRRRR